jgi:methyl coenzyme M reductase gamma subunit
VVRQHLDGLHNPCRPRLELLRILDPEDVCQLMGVREPGEEGRRVRRVGERGREVGRDLNLTRRIVRD